MKATPSGVPIIKTGEELAAKGGAKGTAGTPVTKGPCCFAAGTKVSTPQGDRVIESLKVGDVVWSKPENGGKPFAAAILATHQRSDQPIYRLKLKSVRGAGAAEGETLLVTPSHPFYVPAKRDFIPVKDLEPGDLLQSLADGDTENTSSEVESLELYLPEGKTYNLTVDVGHTFYVGELKTWVHNTGPCDLPPDYFAGGAKGAGEVASIGGKTCVYNCVVDGVTRYVGITNDIVKRGQAHLREKGITIDRIEGLQNLSRADARAVEQTLIDYHGLGKDGGMLINKINSISSVKNPTKYEQGLIRGAELLKKAGYEGF